MLRFDTGLRRMGMVSAATMSTLLLGCAPLAPYRTSHADKPCIASEAENRSSSCDSAIWVRVDDRPDRRPFDVLHAEFDDMGLSHPRGEPGAGEAWNQIESVMQALTDIAKSSSDPISLVVYVHGWKHNASAGDSDVTTFERVLSGMSLAEEQKRRRLIPGEQPRRVVGVFISWRGLSATLEPWKELSFWSRKTAALHVAQGSARYFLARLRTFQRVQNCTAEPRLCSPAAAGVAPLDSPALPVRMVIIGHSFGGLVVFNAMSEYLMESLTEQGAGSAERTGSAMPARQRFGDMVILLNPAFEAVRFTPLQRVAARRAQAAGYPHYQPPLLVMITSSADAATGTFFKYGRAINSLLENELSTEEKAANINTPGHVDMYVTHDLRREKTTRCPGWTEKPTTLQEFNRNIELEDEIADRFFGKADRAGYGTPVVLGDGWTRTFCDAIILQHRADRIDKPAPPYDLNSPHSPIWNIRTNDTLITGHNDVHNALVVSFVQQLYRDVERFSGLGR